LLTFCRRTRLTISHVHNYNLLILRIYTLS
jgi:hypothetical protein